MDSSRGLHRFAVLVAISTLLLIFIGGLVTSTGSGLSVPDWPLSFGRFFPKMEGGVAYEYGHRMAASMVGLLTVILAVWLWKTESRRWVRRLGILAVAAVICQGVLGGMTVLFRLPTVLSVGHAALAEIFLCLTVAIALATSPVWQAKPSRYFEDIGAPSVRALGAVATGFIFVQILLGAAMRHTAGGLAIPDFPLSYGRLVPPFFTSPIFFNYGHRVTGLVVMVFVVWLSCRALGPRCESFAPLSRCFTFDRAPVAGSAGCRDDLVAQGAAPDNAARRLRSAYARGLPFADSECLPRAQAEVFHEFNAGRRLRMMGVS
jgi:heme A synthase